MLPPALVPLPLPLVLWAPLGVVVLVDDGEVPVLGAVVITQGVWATALTGTLATAVVGLVGVEVCVAPGSAADELVAVLLVLVLEGTRLEQPEAVFGSEPVLLSVLDVVEEPPLVFDDLLRVEAPLTGPPNASSAVIFRGTPARLWLGAGGAALAASFGAVETVASTSWAMVWIADGVAAEELVAVLGCLCAVSAGLGAAWCWVGLIACWSSTAPPAVATAATSRVAT